MKYNLFVYLAADLPLTEEDSAKNPPVIGRIFLMQNVLLIGFAYSFDRGAGEGR